MAESNALSQIHKFKPDECLRWIDRYLGDLPVEPILNAGDQEKYAVIEWVYRKADGNRQAQINIETAIAELFSSITPSKDNAERCYALIYLIGSIRPPGIRSNLLNRIRFEHFKGIEYNNWLLHIFLMLSTSKYGYDESLSDYIESESKISGIDFVTLNIMFRILSFWNPDLCYSFIPRILPRLTTTTTEYFIPQLDAIIHRLGFKAFYKWFIDAEAGLRGDANYERLTNVLREIFERNPDYINKEPFVALLKAKIFEERKFPNIPPQELVTVCDLVLGSSDGDAIYELEQLIKSIEGSFHVFVPKHFPNLFKVPSSEVPITMIKGHAPETEAEVDRNNMTMIRFFEKHLYATPSRFGAENDDDATTLNIPPQFSAKSPEAL